MLRRLEAIETRLDSNDKKFDDVLMNLADIKRIYFVNV